MFNRPIYADMHYKYFKYDGFPSNKKIRQYKSHLLFYCIKWQVKINHFTFLSLEYTCSRTLSETFVDFHFWPRGGAVASIISNRGV